MNKHVIVILAVVLIVLSPAGCDTSTRQPFPTDITTLQPTLKVTQTRYSLTPTAFPASTTTSTPAVPTPTQIPKVRLPVRGLYVQFDRRGWDSGYWSGQVLHEFNQYDELVGRLVKEEVADQLDQMVNMGVNYITFELRSSNPLSEQGPYELPNCFLSPELGIQYPQPTPAELTNLVSFLDLVHSKGMKLALRLVNIHHEQKYQAQNEQWLGPILKAIKGHPALDVILFEGSTFALDLTGDGVNETCGVPAEPELFAGPDHPGRDYIQWAIQYGHELGFPWRQLSAQAMEGHFYFWAQGANPFMTDGHFWDPIVVLKMIFDDLGVPDNERTYALSFYENLKCQNHYDLPCVEQHPHAWTIETVKSIFDVVGRDNGARVVAVEMGLHPPEEPEWTSEMAFQSMIWIMQAYGIEGGSLWRWTVFMNYEEKDPTLQMPVRLRGVEDVYTPVGDMVKEFYLYGQANDLSLTPETESPVFRSLSADPGVIQSGEPFLLTANMGETHVFVIADLSPLDPSLKDRVLLHQVSDGIYQREITLDRWNTAPNGTKTIEIEAMDFWSNITTTTLTLELDNPQPVLDDAPPDDDFHGKTIQTTQWNAGVNGGAAISQDEHLLCSTSDQEPFSSTGLSSTWAFEGEFDIQVDFQLGKGWAQPAVEHVDGAFLSVSIDGVEYRITRLRSPEEDKLFYWTSSSADSASAATDTVSGKYRILRSGETLSLLYDIGAGWVEMASATVPALPAQVHLGNGSIGSSLAFETYFDNFQINNGLTTYRP